MKKDNFRFFVPATICKAGDGNDDGELILEGIASTDSEDRQGEILLPEGFEFSTLQNFGFVNWHHQADKNPAAIIGEPIECKLTDTNEFFIKAMLYPESEMAQNAYKLAGVLNNNSKTRRLGWSIEGKALKRDPGNKKRILKARITGVALTYMPINADTFATVVKAMQGDDDIYSGIDEEDLVITKSMQAVNGGKQYSLDITLPGGERIQMEKAKNIKLDLRRALTTDGGRALINESVEGKVKEQALYKADILAAIIEKTDASTPEEVETYYQKFLEQYKAID